MAKFVVEFSPPEKIKSEPCDVTDSVINYRMVLAPFQKQTQVEFNNIKLKEIAVRFLTVVNPLDKSGQYVISPPSDGVYFDIYKFNLEPYSQYELSITWQPFEYGNMRKLIKMEQIDSKRKFDFIILGNCNSPPHKKFKHASSTYSKLKTAPKVKDSYNCKTEIIHLVGNSTKLQEPISTKSLTSPIRRQTYLVGEKENLPISKKQILGRDTILTSPERSIKRPDQKRQDHVFNNHFNIKNLNKSSSSMSDDSLENPLKKIMVHSSQLNDFCLKPLKSTENLLSPFNSKQSDDINNALNFDVTDGNFASISSVSSPFKFEELLGSNITVQNTLNKSEDKKLSTVPLNLCNVFMKMSNDELDTTNTELFVLPQKVEQSSDSKRSNEYTTTTNNIHHRTMITWSGIKSRRPSFAIKNSPYSKCSLKPSMSNLKQCSSSSQATRLKAQKLDKCDQYLKSLANPELFYHNNTEDPFLTMSQYYEAEWLNRQEYDMIRWLNALLTPTDKLIDEEQSGDLEEAAMAWVEASKTCHKNKPMHFATEKDLFVAQIYRQSPQQWSALRKATTNLISSTNVSSVLSKLSISIEKDLITIRDDRQIHLDLSLKKKIIDLLKCYNPLWLQIGMEAIYGQIINIKPGSNDLDGIGWFVRKHLFNNDFVKQNFSKTSVLQVNLPSYNTAMKKFILRKLLMLIYFLDRAKEQQLIRHNPCLFKGDSQYKSSYDILMGFCADMVSAHGDIVRRLRSIGYNLTYKQTHLDEVNYAVKSLNDLRDGTRITKVVEILFKGNPLSPKLRLPAISKLQKIHNVNLAFTRISEYISIEGNISTRDIVNGHREKILSLFWQIIYKYLTPRYNNAAMKIQNWWRNSSLKLIILKRIRAKHIAKRHLAATKIQAHVRGYLTRAQWPNLHTELIENQKMLHVASTKIKHYLKVKLKLLTNERKQFIILKKAVLFVQRKYRSKMSMVKERQQYIKTKQSAVMIQKLFRGFIVRKNWPQIKNNLLVVNRRRIAAVNIIKRLLRKNLPISDDRIKFLKLKNSILYIQRLYKANMLMKIQMECYNTLKSSTVIIQRKFRANVVMKIEQSNYLKSKQSAVIIQTNFRGFMVRKYWSYIKNRLMIEKKLRIDSINILKRTLRKNLPEVQERANFIKIRKSVLFIQQKWRANRIMKIELKYYNILKNATVIIQRKFRANIAMIKEQKNYLKSKQSAVIIQKNVRGFIVRKYWSYIKNRLMIEKKLRIDSINIVKRALRKNLPEVQERENFIKIRNAVLFIQQIWRANRMMKIQIKCYNILRSATVIIQRKFRANIAMEKERKNYLKTKQSVVMTQKMFRGFKVRKNWLQIKNNLLKENARRIAAVNIIKRLLRKNLPISDDRIKFLKLRYSVLYIQRLYKANMLMRIQMEYYNTLKSSTVIIQRKFRANVAMKKEQSNYLKSKQSAVMIQKMFRGFMVRKYWSYTKNHLIIEKRLRIDSINTIKRALRKNLPGTQERTNFLNIKNAVLFIQQIWRANRMMKIQIECYNILRNATVIIQKKFRANVAMKKEQSNYLKSKQSVVMIQKMFRGFKVRKNWTQIKNNLLVENTRRIGAVNIIKRSLRKNLPISDDRIKFLKLRKSVLYIQRLYKANRLMKLQMECYTNLKTTVVMIQRKFRANIAMKKERENYLKIKQSAVMIQKMFRGFKVRKNWPYTQNYLMIEKNIHIADLQKKNNAAIKIQASIRGFLIRKSLLIVNNQVQIQKQLSAAILIQSFWKGYCIRKKYKCRRETVRLPKKDVLTLGKRHNDVVDILYKQHKNEYSYKELATVYWNLDTCTALSKELCVKTAEGEIVDYIFRFLQYSNRSEPSIEARQPAIRVLINLLRYHETKRLIWIKAVNADIVRELIKMMKTSCGKFGASNKLYCSIATWIWIALQDTGKIKYIQNNFAAIIDFKYMLNTLNRKYKMCKINKKIMVLPSTRPTWFIGSKCQKCFESDLYATIQICKILKIEK